MRTGGVYPPGFGLVYDGLACILLYSSSLLDPGPGRMAPAQVRTSGVGCCCCFEQCGCEPAAVAPIVPVVRDAAENSANRYMTVAYAGLRL